MFYRIADLNNIELSSYESVPCVKFSDKLKLPKLKNPKTFIDYFKYLIDFMPHCHKIIKCFHEEISNIKAILSTSQNGSVNSSSIVEPQHSTSTVDLTRILQKIDELDKRIASIENYLSSDT